MATRGSIVLARNNPLTRHHSRVCEALNTAPDVALQSLTGRLYSEGLINKHTKAEVLRHPGYRGADMLMDIINLRVESDPGNIIERVLTIMSDQDCLCDIVQELQQELLTTPSRYDEDTMSGSEASPVVYKSVDELYTEAVNLREKFQEILETFTKSLKNADNDRLKLRLNYHLKCERENTPEVKDILLTIGKLNSPTEVLYCLIHSDLIGYLNYRLLDVFQGLINDKEVDGIITKYEEAQEAFLKSSDLETLAQLFLNHPELAPETFAGLPRFTVHLDKEWEKKSTHQWNQLLKTKFNHWPAHIHIVMITKKCIIIEYCVLPCDAPGIVRDLSDPQILSTEGVTEIQLSDQLRKMGKQEVSNQSPSVYDSHQQSLSLDDSYLFQDQSTDTKHTQQLQTQDKELKVENIEEKNVILLEAVQQGADTATVSTQLKEGANIHTTDEENGYTPLHHAAEKGNIVTVELLLNEGAVRDINRKQRWGETPLHLAALYRHESIIDLLLQYGATVDERDKYGYTPLHHAARYGKKTTVELLLKYKADYSIQSKYGDTMLHSAAEGGNIEIVKLFLELSGMSYLHGVGHLGCTPLHYAVGRGDAEIFDLLIKSGANVDGVKECHFTPLHVAADKNHVDIAELLLKAGANVHSKDKYDARTPLHYAARKGHERIIELLLEYGANIDEKDENGITSLHFAVGADQWCKLKLSDSAREKTVKILLSNGAQVNEQDQNGHTPLYYAKETLVIAQMLLESGATSIESSEADAMRLYQVGLECNREGVIRVPNEQQTPSSEIILVNSTESFKTLSTHTHDKVAIPRIPFDKIVGDKRQLIARFSDILSEESPGQESIEYVN